MFAPSELSKDLEFKTSQWDKGRIHLMTFVKRWKGRGKYTMLTVEIDGKPSNRKIKT